MSKNGLSDKFKGTINKAKGEAKELAGNATDNVKLEAKGKADKFKGEAQKITGEAKDNTHKKIDEFKDKFNE